MLHQGDFEDLFFLFIEYLFLNQPDKLANVNQLAC